jgi:predicted PurR-regulated permease PerM
MAGEVVKARPTAPTEDGSAPGHGTPAPGPAADAGAGQAGPAGSVAPSPSGPTRRARLFEAARGQGIPLAAVLASAAVVVGVYVVAKLAYRLRGILLILLVAGFLAIVLNPLVLALQKRGIRRRGLAVAVVTLVAVLAFDGLVVVFGSPLVNAVTRLAHSLPDYVDQAQHGRGWVGDLARHYHVEAWVQENAPKLASFGASLARPALTLGRGALTLIGTVLTIFTLVVLFLLEGPKLRAGVLGLMSPERAARYTRVAGEVSRSVAGYVLGNALTSLIAGVVVFTTLAILRVPFALLWGLWVALVDFIPQVGGALAGIPTVLYATAHSLTAGVTTLLVFLTYTQLENHVLNPVIMSRTVKVNPLLVLVSVLVAASIGSWVGGTLGGFVGVLLAIPLAGSIQVIVREAWNATAPGEPLRE